MPEEVPSPPETIKNERAEAAPPPPDAARTEKATARSSDKTDQVLAGEPRAKREGKRGAEEGADATDDAPAPTPEAPEVREAPRARTKEADIPTSPVPASPAPRPISEELIKNPALLETLSREEQLAAIMGLVVDRNFATAHDFIERLGKKSDLAFYAWLEDSLHDAALREDWRKFIESQK